MAMDINAADRQCGTRAPYSTRCPRCSGVVVIHCANCQIQVTGCVCSHITRFGERAYEELCSLLGEDEARRMWVAAGHTPPEA